MSSKQPDQTLKPGSRSPGRLLVVFQSPQTAKQIAHALRVNPAVTGHEVEVHATSQSALARIVTERPLLMLVEYGKDSSLAERLLEDLKAKQLRLPVALVSQVSSVEQAPLLDDSNVVDVIATDSLLAPKIARLTMRRLLRTESTGPNEAGISDAPTSTAVVDGIAQMRGIIESLADGVLILDDAARICFANASAGRLFGKDSGELIGRSFGHLQASAQGCELEVQHHGSPEPKIVEVRSADIQWEGAPARLASLRDATEQRRLRAELQTRARELEDSNRELEQFAFVVSHDLRAPLRHIQSFLRLFWNDNAAELSPACLGYLERVGAAALRLEQMIEGILEYSRLGHGSDEGTRLELNEVVNAALENLRLDIEHLGVRVEVHDLPQIWGQPARLLQLYQNMIENAIKYRSDRPLHVEIGCEENREFWKLFVRDNGRGVSEGARARIFELFHRADPSHESGLGMGLAHCRRIVEAHDGVIWVESTLGRGSTFFFNLPVLHEDGPSSATDPNAHLPDRVLRMLLIDDDPNDRELTRQAIARCQLSVEVEDVPTGPEGLQMFHDGQFDCIVLDYALVGMQGPDVVRALRSERVPVIAVSGHAGDTWREEMLEAGAAGALHKSELHRYDLVRQTIMDAMGTQIAS